MKYVGLLKQRILSENPSDGPYQVLVGGGGCT